MGITQSSSHIDVQSCSSTDDHSSLSLDDHTSLQIDNQSLSHTDDQSSLHVDDQPSSLMNDHSSSPIGELLTEQDLFKRGRKSVFSVKSDESDYLNLLEGWIPEYVEYTLGDSYKVTLMDTLKIENLIFYRPIEKIQNGEFERFFGFNCGFSDFMQNKIRFSYGEIFK